MRRLEHLLGLSRDHLRVVADLAGGHYSPFPMSPRPRPFARRVPPPKNRIIDNPSIELKKIQSLIAERLLKPLRLPENLLGGVKGRSVLDNVAYHRSSKTLLKIDVKRFFPSITNEHVYRVWFEMLGCSPAISGLLTQLTTFQRHLPQGAPSSTILANLVLYLCDGPIRVECARQNLSYSSWIDDLGFSGENPRPIIKTVVTTLRQNGFRISRKKLEIAGPRSKKILTGVTIGASLRVPTDRLSRIRSGIHKLRTGAVLENEVAGYVRSLLGQITQVGSTSRKKAERFRGDLERALEQYPGAHC